MRQVSFLLVIGAVLSACRAPVDINPEVVSMIPRDTALSYVKTSSLSNKATCAFTDAGVITTRGTIPYDHWSTDANFSELGGAITYRIGMNNPPFVTRDQEKLAAAMQRRPVNQITLNNISDCLVYRKTATVEQKAEVAKEVDKMVTALVSLGVQYKKVPPTTR